MKWKVQIAVVFCLFELHDRYAWFHVRLCSTIKNNFVRFVSNQTLTTQGNKIVTWEIYADKCQVASPKKQAKNKPKWLVSEVTGHPSVKKTKLLLEWPPTIELEMRKTPNYLQLTCVAWTNGHRDDGTCAESGRALGLLPTFSYWLFYSIIWFWRFKMIVDKFWHSTLFRLNMNRQRKD